MVSASDEVLALGAAEQRLDKWLWYSRMLKSRTMAAQLVTDGKVRVNRTRAVKPSQTVRPGDVLTIALRGRVQVLRVLAAGHRRGPPGEARQLYEPVESRGTSASVSVVVSQAGRERGSGRPTKRDRRLIDRFREQE
jgi:ribosome-associated heat shock protein Hsp15